MSYSRYYQSTDYPDIYKHSYWGSHTTTDKSPNTEIIKNRNEFIKRFQIAKYKRLTLPQWYKHEHEHPANLFIDHKEYYEDIYGRMIYVCSQHNPYPLYKQMKPIYASNQWSGYQIVETTKSKKLLMKQIFDKFPPEISKYIQTYLPKSKSKKNYHT